MSSNGMVAKEFLHSREVLFPAHKDCWTTEPLEAIKSRSVEVARKIRELDETPTLIGVADGNEIPTWVSLVSGWCQPADWGVWSKGETSVLEFRIPYRYVKFEQRKFCVIIAGQYYGENTRTNVTINGKSFGEQVLVDSNREITISSDDLCEYGLVRVQLTHLVPISPQKYEGRRDPRQLAFALTRIGCVPLD
jgi:hypothetical protein